MARATMTLGVLCVGECLYGLAPRRMATRLVVNVNPERAELAGDFNRHVRDVGGEARGSIGWILGSNAALKNAICAPGTKPMGFSDSEVRAIDDSVLAQIIRQASRI